MIRLSISIKGDIDGLAGEVRERIDSGFDSMLSALHASARRTAPVRTGRLRDSIRSFVSGRLSGGVSYGAPYASFLLSGTGIYGPRGRMIVIRPRKKQALHWRGAADPVKVVRQKGIRPMDFLKKAVREAGLKKAFHKGFDK
jgi:hypothetical protein